MLCTGCLEHESSNLGNGFNLFSFNRKVAGSGHLIKKERAISDFSKVVLSEEGDLFIEAGSQESLVVEAEENLQEYIIADVNNDTLEIYKQPEDITLEPAQPIKYYLSATNLEELIVKNSGDVEINEITGESFSVRITGSGSVEIKDLQVSNLEAELTSSGDLVILKGDVESQKIRLSSSGEYDGRNLGSQNAIVEVSSGGSAIVNAKNSLMVDISSSGDVLYSGNPEIIIRNMSSTGKMRRIH